MQLCIAVQQAHGDAIGRTAMGFETIAQWIG